MFSGQKKDCCDFCNSLLLLPILALALLMLGILADHHDLAFALDNLALFADRLDRRPDFHEDSSFDSSDQLLLRQVIRPRVRS